MWCGSMATAPLYELRRGGETMCRSTIPNLGYPPEVLKDMERHGMRLYCDGKKVKSHRQSGNSDSGIGVDGLSTPNISNFGGNVNERAKIH
jgi:hypothetical protein